MANIGSILSGGVIGVGVGEAASTALDPVFEPITQDSWDKAVGKGVTKLLNADQLAQLVATALESLAGAEPEAARDG